MNHLLIILIALFAIPFVTSAYAIEGYVSSIDNNVSINYHTTIEIPYEYLYEGKFYTDSHSSG